MYLPPLLSVMKINFFLVSIATRAVVCLLMLILVLSYQFLEILVVFPKLKVFALSLESSHFVQDAKVGSAVFWAELLRYLLEQLHLVLSQKFAVGKLVEVKKCAIFLDSGS